MNKKGFTLIELLVVIAIISILSLLVVPNIININRNVDKRLYAQKVEYIISSAELYASNNPEIFNGSDVVEIPVYTLIEAGYLNPDEGVDCDKSKYPNGCIVNPENNNLLNEETVTVTKKSVGIVGEFNGTLDESSISSSEELVKKVCAGFGKSFDGKFGTGEKDTCECIIENNGNVKLVKSNTNESVDYCIIVSNKPSGEVNNWLKYGSNEANWRVVGLYNIDGKVSAKMITSGVVK